MAIRWTRLSAQNSVAGVMLAISLGGCDSNHSTHDTTPTPAVASSADPLSTDKAGSADPRMQQTFAEATRSEPPADWQRPPDLTLAGKSVGKLYTEVVRLWDTIRFTSKDGKPIAYAAILETELGVHAKRSEAIDAPSRVFSSRRRAVCSIETNCVFTSTTTTDPVSGWPARMSTEPRSPNRAYVTSTATVHPCRCRNVATAPRSSAWS